MASSSGRPVYTDARTGRTFYYDKRTGEIVFSDGSRVLAASQFAQPATNVPRTAAGAVRQLPSNAFSSQPYNQQYTNSPPIASGSSVGNVTQQLHNVNIAQPSTSAKSAIPYAAGRPIDGAEVLRNPPVRGTPPRQLSFTHTVQNRLLDPAYKVKQRPTKYFVPGKVFLTLWTEAASEASVATSDNDVFAVAYGEHAFCRVRRFVVVRSGSQSCSALAVSTHSGRGSPKNNKNEHGVIYTGKLAPDTGNEPGLQLRAIKVNPDEKGAVFDPKSRINYGKLYNVEYNVKVKNFGSLSPEYLKVLIEQFSSVFTSRIRTTAALAPGPLDRDENRPDMTGNSPKGKQQFLDPTRRGAVAQHTRHVNNAAAGGRAAGPNTTGVRGQRPVQEAVESDDEDDDEEAGNPVEKESSDEDDDEEGDDDDGDDAEDDDDDDENDDE